MFLCFKGFLEPLYLFASFTKEFPLFLSDLHVAPYILVTVKKSTIKVIANAPVTPVTSAAISTIRKSDCFIA
jgi:hypothetical protein